MSETAKLQMAGVANRSRGVAMQRVLACIVLLGALGVAFLFVIVGLADVPAPGEEVWIRLRNESSNTATVSLSSRREPVELVPGGDIGVVATRVRPGGAPAKPIGVVVFANGRELVRGSLAPHQLVASPEIVIHDGDAAFRTGGPRP